jgi:hypothetical protein
LYHHAHARCSMVSTNSTEVVNFQYHTEQNTNWATETWTIRDNCDGNWQYIGHMSPNGMVAQGQAIRFQMTGSHFINSWNLQYLAFEVAPQDPGNLRVWEA